jgi:hypothetical protein
MTSEVQVLDSRHTLDARRHALVVTTEAGEVLFRFYEDTGACAYAESLTLRGVEYKASGRFRAHCREFSVHDIKRNDWARSNKQATEAVQRTITTIVRDALQSAQLRGHIVTLERATRRWNAQSRLDSITNERQELHARLIQLETEMDAACRVLAEVSL